MNLQARIAVEALRAGVPNRAAVRLMGTEESGIEQAFDTLLASVWQDGIQQLPGVGIAGGFGSGKSHFLGYLSEVALGQNFVVSRVVISKETPLANPGLVFEAALRSARMPDRNDDPVAGALGILRESPERMDALELAVREPKAGLAPIFAAILYLARRPSTAPDVLRRCERFLSGARLTAASIRPTLSSAGAGQRFDLKMPPGPELAIQRIAFLSRLFHAAGFAGWCILLDEMELIGRYPALQRARAYAWLSTWLGLPGAARFPGIATAYAITDDFVSAVIDARHDEEKLPDRLELKGGLQQALSVRTAIGHLGATVRRHRLRTPGHEELVRLCERLRQIYTDAYDWPAPALPPMERTATRTIRQYIKSWIAQWDMLRLTGQTVTIVEQALAVDYDEDVTLGELPPVADEDA